MAIEEKGGVGNAIQRCVDRRIGYYVYNIIQRLYDYKGFGPTRVGGTDANVHVRVMALLFAREFIRTEGL